MTGEVGSRNQMVVEGLSFRFGATIEHHPNLLFRPAEHAVVREVPGSSCGTFALCFSGVQDVVFFLFLLFFFKTYIYIYYITYNHCTEAVPARHITKKVQDEKDIKII